MHFTNMKITGNQGPTEEENEINRTKCAGEHEKYNDTVRLPRLRIQSTEMK